MGLIITTDMTKNIEKQTLPGNVWMVLMLINTSIQKHGADDIMGRRNGHI